MKAEEERRLGIERSGDGELSDGDFRDSRGGFIGIFQVELDGFLKVCKGLLLGGSEAGDVVIQALGHEAVFLAVEGVVDLFQAGILAQIRG